MRACSVSAAVCLCLSSSVQSLERNIAYFLLTAHMIYRSTVVSLSVSESVLASLAFSVADV